MLLFRPAFGLDDCVNRIIEWRFGHRVERGDIKIQFQIVRPWEARFDIHKEFRQGFILNPVPVIKFIIFREEFIPRVYCRDDHQGTIAFNHDVIFVVVDVLIHHTEAGHRYKRIRGTINREEGELQMIYPCAFRYPAGVYSNRNVGGENGSSVHSEEETPAVTSTLGYRTLFNLEAG